MTTFAGQPDDVSVTTENLQQFTQQYSSEIVQGYALALKDILGEIEQIAFFRPGIVLNSPGVARSKLLEFYVQKNHLIKQFETLSSAGLTKNDKAVP